MGEKTFPLPKEELEKLVRRYPTPFYLYDERGIRENARALTRAFGILPGFLEYFAVKALPNPFILKILSSEGFGADCSSYAELLLADMAGIRGERIMFSSNETPAREYKAARDLGAVINLDDFTHIDYLERHAGIPELISCRYNPGSAKSGNAIIGKPLEAKYGFTRDQILRAYPLLAAKGARRFGIHAMVASNELFLEYHIETARMLFELAVEIKEKTGLALEFINLGGGVGIPYKVEDQAIDYQELAEGIEGLYRSIIVPAGLGSLRIRIEWGRAITGPYGWLVSTAIHTKSIYREYIGLDSCMADLMRPALYSTAYHHITVAGKETAPSTETYDVVGSLCENNDKFAIQRSLPKIDPGDLVIIHDAGAHGRAMGFNYNGKLRCGELLLRSDGTIMQIRRPETVEDYFATLDREAFKNFQENL
ncbi:MAG: diaminopimelate decarboxylase [Spirochaetaceae bacterium]|jgi:diaminopimelate decarboxylase|nr:diaminopimelate decarboxylase [Spirochaetaceae bacterium]